MPDLQFSCSNCGEAITVSSDQAGFVTYCPNCQAELIVPEIEVPAQPEPPPQNEPPPTAPQPPGDPGFHESPSQILERKMVRHTEQARPVAPPPEPPPAPPADMPELRPLGGTQDGGLQAPTPPLTPADPGNQTTILSPDTFNEIAETEIYDPQALSGRARLDDGYLEAHAGEVHIDSDVHAYVHENSIPHTHAVPYYNGVFQPFGENDITAALAEEDPNTLARVQTITPGPTAWPCSVFGVLIEARLVTYLPESLPEAKYPSVMFGSADKFFPQIRELQPRFLSIVSRLSKIMGADFQYALTHYDLDRMVDIACRLEDPLAEIYDFMIDVQELALPKKDPLPRLREMVLSWYPQVRVLLADLVQRLYNRSILPPEQADLRIVNVSVTPAGLHYFNQAMRTVPVIG